MAPHYPRIEINLDAVRDNARVLCGLCETRGISVAGVIKSSDGRVPVAKAYLAGGCRQIAVSRAKHLPGLRAALPDTELMLTRAPGPSDVETAARYADLILSCDEDGLLALERAAARLGANPGVLLMYDVGDLREGVDSPERLCELAELVENRLPHVRLRGVGTNPACLNGVLPTWENMTELADAAGAVEKRIGRRLEWISGGSSINLMLMKPGQPGMPERINHLRLGGPIANPRNIRIERDVSFPGLREDSMRIRAEIVEIEYKNSMPRGVTALNWESKPITAVDRGRRLRAILALGSQDIGNAMDLTPLEPGVEILGCSSDHTIVDVTEYAGTLRYGDVLSFRLKYSPMLHAFSGKHVSVGFTHDKR